MRRRLETEAEGCGGAAVHRASLCVAEYLQGAASQAARFSSPAPSHSVVARRGRKGASKGGDEEEEEQSLLAAVGLPPGYSFRCFGLEDAVSIQEEVYHTPIFLYLFLLFLILFLSFSRMLLQLVHFLFFPPSCLSPPDLTAASSRPLLPTTGSH